MTSLRPIIHRSVLRKEVFNRIFVPELDSQQISRLVLFQTETVLCLRTAETLVDTCTKFDYKIRSY